MKIRKTSGLILTFCTVAVLSACNMNSKEDKSGSSTNDTTATAGKSAADSTMAKAPKKKMKASVKMSSTDAKMKIEKDREGVYTRVEAMPEFPGGETALADYIQNNVNYDPSVDNNAEGTVRVSFVVDENGKAEMPKVVGEKTSSNLENEVVRAINQMPSWKPGMVKGKAVKTRLELPITFKESE